MITSTSNERIKQVVQLVKSAKARRKEGLFVVEGERMAREIPKSILKECFISEDYLSHGEGMSIFEYDVTPEVVSSAVFKKMSDTLSPSGILCTCRQNVTGEDELFTKHDAGEFRLLLLEGIQDPGNLGTMLRCAEGAGFDAVIADGNTVDVYNPKVTRSTMGSIFRVPVIYTDDLPSTVDKLKEKSVKVYAAHLQGTTDYNDEQYGSRLAFLIGNEGNGLSEEISKRADKLLKIPMKGKLESLNAAIAAALLMFNANS